MNFYLTFCFICLYSYSLAQQFESEITVTFDCPLQSRKFICDINNKFSEFDGACNNLDKPWYGRANVPFKRYLTASYDDSFSMPRSRSVSGRPLPNPRVLSKFLSMDNNVNFNSPYTHMLGIFGQFMAHDMTNSPSSQKPDGSFPNCDCNTLSSECISISMPSNDNIVRMSCMKFIRTAPAFPTLDCGFRIREQLNTLSSFLDASQIYGTTSSRARSLRFFQGGLLRSSQGPFRSLLPLSPNENCGDLNAMVNCFMAGEERASENLGLSGVHTLFMREHNRIATELARVNPFWNDEKLYLETRRIIIAMYQHIVFTEWLPIVVGRRYIDSAELRPAFDGFYYNGYDPKVNPTLANEFATAAFRFGHTLIRNKIGKFNSNGFAVAASLNISQVIFKTSQAFNSNEGGIESLFLGLINEPASKYDTNIADSLQNHLFEFVSSDGSVTAVDLFAANINRGRDHGIPGYNSFREKCGIPRARSFQDLIDVMPWENVQKLSSIYENVEDIDFYVGGLSENPIPDGVVGPTFACIIANQFRELKKGDRFFYENGPFATSFTIDQLKEIKKASLSRLICNDFDINFIQRNAFLMASQNNPRFFCSDLPNIDFTKWRGF